MISDKELLRSLGELENWNGMKLLEEEVVLDFAIRVDKIIFNQNNFLGPYKNWR